MNKVKILELFGGIGAIRKAFINLKIPYEVVDYVETDKACVKSFALFLFMEVRNECKRIFKTSILFGQEN